MKKKEILARLNTPVFEGLIIFVLAVMITALASLFSFDKCFVTLTSICHFTHCRGWPLNFYYFYTLNPSFPEDCRENYPPKFIRSFLVADFLFWFLVIFAIWKVIKWTRGKYGKKF